METGAFAGRMVVKAANDTPLESRMQYPFVGHERSNREGHA
jgi:hypothetical protein